MREGQQICEEVTRVCCRLEEEARLLAMELKLAGLPVCSAAAGTAAIVRLADDCHCDSDYLGLNPSCSGRDPLDKDENEGPDDRVQLDSERMPLMTTPDNENVTASARCAAHQISRDPPYRTALANQKLSNSAYSKCGTDELGNLAASMFDGCVDVMDWSDMVCVEASQSLTPPKDACLEGINYFLPVDSWELKEQLKRRYGDYIQGLDMESVRRKKKVALPAAAIHILKEWWKNHLDKPYPTEMEKREMAVEGLLTMKQINYWFINQRKRHWLKKAKRGEKPKHNE
ncbi:hypothetical protein CBR_g36337 [Chara braunii]|uniref:Homeobox domain-containing protein n=1 Tax=Chara braunii TaxID=69332 RepID=A0A388LKE7_CHABU|nr:hypothetical protein CBR_g36337 [Chara braunii]|eukprot:GBG82806.1 hypothetical protein CBR_g36337 [Chara braunii]